MGSYAVLPSVGTCVSVSGIASCMASETPGVLDPAVIVRGTTNNGLIGAWLLTARCAVIVFLDNSHYVQIEDETPDGDGWPGMEIGTYTWKHESGRFLGGLAFGGYERCPGTRADVSSDGTIGRLHAASSVA